MHIHGIILYTAHEIWQLFHILPLLIGDLVPVGDAHYINFMALQEISAILCADVITADQLAYLQILIQEYLSNLTSLYPDVSLTPKCHYLVHCPSFLKR